MVHGNILGPIFCKSLRIIDGKTYEIPSQLRIKTLKEIYPKNMKKQHNTSRTLKASEFLLVSSDYKTKGNFQVSVTSELAELNGKAL